MLDKGPRVSRSEIRKLFCEVLSSECLLGAGFAYRNVEGLCDISNISSSIWKVNNIR